MADKVFHHLALGNCIHVLRSTADNTIDSVVTDPPYGLEFMGRDFDGANGFRRSLNKADVERPNVFGRTSRTSPEYRLSSLFQEFTHAWATEALRVLKPGGYLLAFGGSRTYHRLACGIEDAGFEVRDQIQWLYGSGFPKSLNVGKAIDKSAGCEREVVGKRVYGDGHVQNSTVFTRPIGTFEMTAAREETLPATDKAKLWEGWGTALKPAHEPIVVARKPLVGTVVENVLQYGTGAINIDGCRIGTTKDVPASVSHNKGTRCMGKYGIETGQESGHNPDVGRWPANVIHDGSEEVMDEFAKYGERKSCTSPSSADPEGRIFGGRRTQGNLPMDSGTAARFFYCSKASRKERGPGNDWPTVKPLALMRYLCRLVTPPGGIVLDPFVGSGTTGLAAILEGFSFEGIDADEKALAIARQRFAAIGLMEEEAQ